MTNLKFPHFFFQGGRENQHNRPSQQITTILVRLEFELKLEPLLLYSPPATAATATATVTATATATATPPPLC